MYTFFVYRGDAVVIRRVVLSRLAEKQLRRMPRHVAAKLLEWVRAVKREGLERVRVIHGFHDEPLRGARRGQRSIRLSRSYRAIYVVLDWGPSARARIEEVSKDEY